MYACTHTHTHAYRQSLLFIPNTTGRFRAEEAEWNIFQPLFQSPAKRERRPFVADDNKVRFSQFLSLHSALISGALNVCSSSASTLSTVTDKKKIYGANEMEHNAGLFASGSSVLVCLKSSEALRCCDL